MQNGKKAKEKEQNPPAQDKTNDDRPTNNDDNDDHLSPSPVSNKNDIECSLGIYEWIRKLELEQDMERALEVDQDKRWWSGVETSIIAVRVAMKEHRQAGEEERAAWKRAEAERQHPPAINQQRQCHAEESRQKAAWVPAEQCQAWWQTNKDKREAIQKQ